MLLFWSRKITTYRFSSRPQRLLAVLQMAPPLRPMWGQPLTWQKCRHQLLCKTVSGTGSILAPSRPCWVNWNASPKPLMSRHLSQSAPTSKYFLLVAPDDNISSSQWWQKTSHWSPITIGFRWRPLWARVENLKILVGTPTTRVCCWTSLLFKSSRT